MNEEAADELVGGERHHLVSITPIDPVVLPLEGHAGIVERDQATVGDGDAVGCQNAHLSRRSSTGHSGTRSNTKRRPQLDRSCSINAPAYDPSDPLTHLNQSARSPCLNSHTISAAIKSP